MPPDMPSADSRRHTLIAPNVITDDGVLACVSLPLSLSRALSLSLSLSLPPSLTHFSFSLSLSLSLSLTLNSGWAKMPANKTVAAATILR